MINLELPQSLAGMQMVIRQVANDLLRGISRKYDVEEHTVAKELQILAQGRQEIDPGGGGAKKERVGNQNGGNLRTVVTVREMSWGDVGLMLAIPGSGLGNAAITAVATPEQKQRLGKVFASMAITEPGAGSDSANVSTTAVLDGDEWVLNGEKIFVTAGNICDHVVVWATLDRSRGRAAIKSFVVPRHAPGCEVVKLEHKLGIRASDTATIRLENCRIPKGNLLGTAEIAADAKQAFGGVMQTFDNTRPVVAAMSVGVASAALERTKQLLEAESVKLDYADDLWNSSAVQAEFYRMEADLESAWALIVRAAWMADNKQPNSKEASIAKAKAGRVATQICLRCVQLCQAAGYGTDELIEKWARDVKILDIFEGTQQIQQLIVARRELGLGSAELK